MKIYQILLVLFIIFVTFNSASSLSPYEITEKARQLSSEGDKISKPIVIEIDDENYYVFIFSSFKQIQYVVFDSKGNIISGEKSRNAVWYLLTYEFVEKKSKDIREHVGFADKAIERIQVEDKKSFEAQVEETAQRLGEEFEEAISPITENTWEKIITFVKSHVSDEQTIYVDALGRVVSTNAKHIVVSAGPPAVKVGIKISKDLWNVLRSETDFISKASQYTTIINGLATNIEGYNFEKSETEVVLFNTALYRLPKILKVLQLVTNDPEIKEILENESKYFNELYKNSASELYFEAERHMFDGENIKQNKIDQFERDCDNTNSDLNDLLITLDVAVHLGKDINLWEFRGEINSMKETVKSQRDFAEIGYYNDAINGCKNLQEIIKSRKDEINELPRLEEGIVGSLKVTWNKIFFWGLL